MRMIEQAYQIGDTAENWLKGIPDNHKSLFIPADANRFLLLNQLIAYTLKLELVAIVSKYETKIGCSWCSNLYLIQKSYPKLIFATNEGIWRFLKNQMPWLESILNAWTRHWHQAKPKVLD